MPQVPSLGVVEERGDRLPDGRRLLYEPNRASGLPSPHKLGSGLPGREVYRLADSFASERPLHP